MRLDVLRAIDACYACERQDARWLRGLLEALAPLDLGAGMFAQVFRIEPGGRRLVEASLESPSSRPGLLDRIEASLSAAGWPARAWAGIAPVQLALRRARSLGPAVRRELERLFARDGIRDTLGIAGADPGGRVALVAVPIRIGARVPAPQTLHQLKLFAAHLGASMRLRRAVGVPGPEPAVALAAEGLDAAPGPGRTGRDSLADALRRLDPACGPLRDSAPGEALRLWQELVEGRWSVVDRIERDGRRYLLARRIDPGVHDPQALTERERAVVAFAALGHQNKLIADALGLCPSAVALHLSSARRKLRLGSRAELVQEFAALVRGGADPGAGA